MSFPVEAVPDGAVYAPHHYIYGIALALVMVFVVWDNLCGGGAVGTGGGGGVG